MKEPIYRLVYEIAVTQQNPEATDDQKAIKEMQIDEIIKLLSTFNNHHGANMLKGYYEKLKGSE